MELLLIVLDELQTQDISASLANALSRPRVCLVAVQVIVPTNCIAGPSMRKDRLPDQVA